jgi:hypothetical protein
VELTANLDDARLQRLANLRRRQADPGRLAHRLGHVVEQLVEVFPEAIDGQALQSKARIAEENDRSDTHRRSIPTVERD